MIPEEEEVMMITDNNDYSYCDPTGGQDLVSRRKRRRLH